MAIARWSAADSIPRERVAELCKRLVIELADEDGQGGLNLLSFHTGVNVRDLRRIINGPSECELRDRTTKTGRVKKGSTHKWVKFRTLDRILTGMDLTHLWHYDPEDGGFADVYSVDRSHQYLMELERA